MLAHKIRVVIPEDRQLVVDVPPTFRSGPAELILLAPVDDAAAESPKTQGSLAKLAAELARDPRPFQQLAPEEKRSRLAQIRGSAKGLLPSSADFAQRKAEEIECH